MTFIHSCIYKMSLDVMYTVFWSGESHNMRCMTCRGLCQDIDLKPQHRNTISHSLWQKMMRWSSFTEPSMQYKTKVQRNYLQIRSVYCRISVFTDTERVVHLLEHEGTNSTDRSCSGDSAPVQAEAMWGTDNTRGGMGLVQACIWLQT